MSYEQINQIIKDYEGGMHSVHLQERIIGYMTRYFSSQNRDLINTLRMHIHSPEAWKNAIEFIKQHSKIN